MVKIITKEEIYSVQEEWAEGMAQIGEAWSNANDYVQVATDFIHRFYGYDLENHQVLFKPTRAAVIQFRSTFAGALSYFVGGNLEFPEDAGFALEPWSFVELVNHDILLHGDIALAMGKKFCTAKSGNLIEAEFSLGYVRSDAGDLKIVLHHSSLPFKPNK
jgi:hypothetical protein